MSNILTMSLLCDNILTESKPNGKRKEENKMCGGMPVQLGVPLNNAVLNRMTDQERSFWLDFLEEAKKSV